MTEVPNPYSDPRRMIRWAFAIVIVTYLLALDIGYLHYKTWKNSTEIEMLQAQSSHK